jgi:hypothetical protein
MLCYIKPFNLTLSFLPIAGFFLSLYVGGDSEIVAFRSLRDAHHHHCVPSEVLHMNSEVTDTGQEVQSHDATVSHHSRIATVSPAARND